MQDFKKRSGRGRRYLRMLGGLLFLAVLVLAAAAASRAAFDMYQKFAEASAADAATQGELANLKAQYAEASSTVGSLRTREGAEAAMRERYGLALPGEGQITIVRQATDTPQGAGGPSGFWARLWHALFVW